MRIARIALALTILISIGGCWGSKYLLAPPEQATLDPKLLGDWQADGKEDHFATRIMNLDGHQYLFEMRDEKNKIDNYVVFLCDVSGVTFIEMRPIKDEAELETAWIIARLDRDGDGYKIRQLDDKYFKPLEDSIDSSQKLRAVLSEHLNDAKMYAPDETLRLHRGAATTMP